MHGLTMKKIAILSGLVFSLGAGQALASSKCGVEGLYPCPTPFDKTLPDVADMLTWTQQERVIGFRNDYRNYPGDVFKRSKSAYPLPISKTPLTHVNYVYQGKKYTLSDYLKHQSVQGLLFIKDGKIKYEYFANDNNKTTLWTSRSVGKSVVSTLVGIALKEGKITSLDDPITQYEPQLKGTAWDGVTLKQLLTHTSGVQWNEDYTDPKSDFSKLTQCEANPKTTYKCVSNLVFNLKRVPTVKPGDVWSYNTGGAWLVGDILEKATGQSLAKYLQEKVWQPFGMASDGVWHAYEKGKHDMGGHGFNATLEDWGRFGLFVLKQGELPNGKKSLPDNWLQEATSWTHAKNSVTPSNPNGTYGYQWWNHDVPADATQVAPKWNGDSNESLWALGIYGQIIAIDKKEKVIMVQWSTWADADPAPDKQGLEDTVFFNAAVDQLKK